jgi:hypothetical protein
MQNSQWKNAALPATETRSVSERLVSTPRQFACCMWHVALLVALTSCTTGAGKGNEPEEEAAAAPVRIGTENVVTV